MICSPIADIYSVLSTVVCCLLAWTSHPMIKPIRLKGCCAHMPTIAKRYFAAMQFRQMDTGV
jgi:hypothetical protein